jgi:hypothetical protein
VAQLQDVQSALCLDLVAGDDVRVTRREVDGGPGYSPCDYGGCDACGNEGWDGDDHVAFFLVFFCSFFES